MKNIFVTTLLATLVCFTNAQVKEKAKPDCKPGVTINSNFSKAPALDSIMKAYTTNALPGAAMAVYSEAEGWWAGLCRHGAQIPMDNCHLQYLQSVSKSYMAIEILQLKEQGKIELDAPMTKYLPAKYNKRCR